MSPSAFEVGAAGANISRLIKQRSASLSLGAGTIDLVTEHEVYSICHGLSFIVEFMKVKIIGMLVCLFVFADARTFASLGDTEAQIQNKYGPPIAPLAMAATARHPELLTSSVAKINALNDAEFASRIADPLVSGTFADLKPEFYKAEAYYVFVLFKNGRSVCEVYDKYDHNFEIDQLDAVLAESSFGFDWKMVQFQSDYVPRKTPNMIFGEYFHIEWKLQNRSDDDVAYATYDAGMLAVAATSIFPEVFDYEARHDREK